MGRGRVTQYWFRLLKHFILLKLYLRDWLLLLLRSYKFVIEIITTPVCRKLWLVVTCPYLLFLLLFLLIFPRIFILSEPYLIFMLWVSELVLIYHFLVFGVWVLVVMQLGLRCFLVPYFRRSHRIIWLAFKDVKVIEILLHVIRYQVFLEVVIILLFVALFTATLCFLLGFLIKFVCFHALTRAILFVVVVANSIDIVVLGALLVLFVGCRVWVLILLDEIS
jgi:hypothetical protein